MAFADRFRRQSRAERDLIDQVVVALTHRRRQAPRILNIGAGNGAVIETLLAEAGVSFICDRLDIVDCRVNHPNVGECWTCPVEAMQGVPSGVYRVAFANFVLEHVQDIRAAAGEICRVLAPGCTFVATVPNPAAPEFLVARYAPGWFRTFVAGRKPWANYYSYRTVPQLVATFVACGLRAIGVRYSSCLESYLARVPPLHLAGRLYDRAAARLQAVGLMGHACIVMEKPGRAGGAFS